MADPKQSGTPAWQTPDPALAEALRAYGFEASPPVIDDEPDQLPMGRSVSDLLASAGAQARPGTAAVAEAMPVPLPEDGTAWWADSVAGIETAGAEPDDGTPSAWSPTPAPSAAPGVVPVPPPAAPRPAAAPATPAATAGPTPPAFLADRIARPAPAAEAPAGPVEAPPARVIAPSTSDLAPDAWDAVAGPVPDAVGVDAVVPDDDLGALRAQATAWWAADAAQDAQDADHIEEAPVSAEVATDAWATMTAETAAQGEPAAAAEPEQPVAQPEPAIDPWGAVTVQAALPAEPEGQQPPSEHWALAPAEPEPRHEPEAPPGDEPAAPVAVAAASVPVDLAGVEFIGYVSEPVAPVAADAVAAAPVAAAVPVVGAARIAAPDLATAAGVTQGATGGDLWDLVTAPAPPPVSEAAPSPSRLITVLLTLLVVFVLLSLILGFLWSFTDLLGT